ncbi:prenyltransferase/squalene oxidase repeat-containing protein [Lentilactobacillus senioris]|uniref:prenyltransferase/squalene oxidase repeat-containing protein n=1 Tax=Lentilactobacillus senioris TaxID=931534 RepID=UPI003D2E9318
MTKKKLYSLLCAVTLLSSPLVSLVPSVQAQASTNVTSQQTIEKAFKKANKAATKKQVLNNDYQSSIANGVMSIMATVMNNPDSGSSWGALAVARDGMPAQDMMTEQFSKAIGKDVDGMVSQNHFSGTDLERSIIGIAAVGEDPTNFHKLNLIDKTVKQIAADQKASASYGHTLGSNELIYGIIALSTGNYGTKIDSTVNDLVKQLLETQNADGGWDLNNQGTNDVDITGMALTALGMHKDQSGVQTAINKAVKMLKTKAFVPSTGGFLIPSSFSKEENSSSIAMAVTGLASCGIDPATEFSGTSGVNPINRLIAYQQPAGYFRWVFNDDGGAISMATEQAVYALEQYQFMKQGDGSIFDFKINPSHVDNSDGSSNHNNTGDENGKGDGNGALPELPGVSKKVQQSISDASNAVQTMINEEIKSGNFTGSDIIFGAARANLISKDQTQSLYEELLKQSKKGNLSKTSDLSRVILNMEALGIDPTDFDDRDLVKELNQAQDITNKGTYVAATSLLALESGHFNDVITSPSKVQELVQVLLNDSKNYDNEAWGFETDGAFTKDIDTTAVTVSALKTLVDNKDDYQLTDDMVSSINAVLQKATDFLTKSQLTDGGFGYSGSKTSNVNSTAVADVAFSTMDKDTGKVQNDKAQNSAIDALINYQQKDGTFKTDYSPELATGQALLGLEANVYQAQQKGSVYDFAKNSVAKFVPNAAVKDGSKTNDNSTTGSTSDETDDTDTSGDNDDVQANSDSLNNNNDDDNGDVQEDGTTTSNDDPDSYVTPDENRGGYEDGYVYPDNDQDRLPQTGSASPIAMIIVGLMLLASEGYFYFKDKKAKM